MVFSDNGASAEGGTQGTFNEHRFTAHGRESLAENLARYDDWGGHTTYNHYSWGWAWAGNTPHRLWKRYTWLGGTRTPLIVHWPGHVARPGAVRPQFTHAIDLMPTVLEAAGLAAPEQVDGVAQQPVEGLSLMPALGDPGVAEKRRTQYFEMLGSRSIYHDGWKATTDHISTGVLDEEELAVGSRRFDEDRWELFDLETDFSEAHDRAGDEPQRVRHLTDLWTAEAARNNVLPISDGLVDRLAGFIPAAWPAGQDRVFRPGGGPVCDESVPLLWGGFHMTADVDVHADAGANGVVFALGDWFGGYALYAVDGRMHFSFARSIDSLELETPEPLAAGRHDIAVFYGLGEGPHAAGRMVLLVDGAAVGEIPVEGTLPLALQHGGAGLRLGYDSGFPVSPRYAPPAPFSGVVHQLRVEAPGALQADPDDEVRAALHAGLTVSNAANGTDLQEDRASRACPRCSRVCRAPTAANASTGKGRPPAGPNGALRSSSSSRSARRKDWSCAPFCSRRASVSSRPTASMRSACAALARSMSSAVSATPSPLVMSWSQRTPWPWPTAMWCSTTPTDQPSPGTGAFHPESVHPRTNAIASALAAAKSSASARARSLASLASLAMGHPRQRAQLLDPPRTGRRPFGGSP